MRGLSNLMVLTTRKLINSCSTGVKRLRSVTVKVLDVFRMVMSKEECTKFANESLVALRCGFAKGIDESRPIMRTTHVWQAIV